MILHFAASAVCQSDFMRHFEFPEMLEILQLLEHHFLLFLAAVQFLFGCGLIIYSLYKDGGVFCPGGFT